MGQPHRQPPFALAPLALLLALMLGACGQGEEDATQEQIVGVVQAFSESAGDDPGAACDLLDVTARRRLEQTSGGDCGEALGARASELGGSALEVTDVRVSTALAQVDVVVGGEQARLGTFELTQQDDGSWLISQLPR